MLERIRYYVRQRFPRTVQMLTVRTEQTKPLNVGVASRGFYARFVTPDTHSPIKGFVLGYHDLNCQRTINEYRLST